jgi:hypothetical protein
MVDVVVEVVVSFGRFSLSQSFCERTKTAKSDGISGADAK